MDLNVNGAAATYASLLMRVPPLFIMDEILKISFGFAPTDTVPIKEPSYDESYNTPFWSKSYNGQQEPMSGVSEYILDSSELPELYHQQPHNTTILTEHEPHLLPFLMSPVLPLVLKVIFLTLAFLLSKVWFSLCWPHLLSLYSVLGSLFCVVASYQSNVATVHYFFSSSSNTDVQQPLLLHTLLSLDVTGIVHNSSPVLALGSNYVVQVMLYLAFMHMQVDIEEMVVLKGLMIWSFLLPSCSMLITFSKDITLTFSIACALLPLLLTKWRIIKNIPYAIGVIIRGIRYAQEAINNFGVHAVLEREWVRLNVPNVLRLFWILRVANFLVFSVAKHLHELDSFSLFTLLNPVILYSLFKSTLTYGCDTVIALLGMTSIVYYVSHYIGVFFQMLLLTGEDDDRNMGTVSAILFFVLAEQSGLTVLENEKRYIRLCRNFCLLFTAMLYFVHNMVNTVLMSLSASRNPSVYRHARALGVCSILLLLPLSLLYALWSVFTLSTWLLAVSAFSVQVIIKTLVTVLLYTLFLADAYDSLLLDNLDDYVYYIKAFGNTIEFLFGIVLFFNGLWIYFFESGGAIRALMMCVHAYINIWCEAKNGWSAFIKRRNAVNKIASIPNATRKQLQEHNDVCAICFQMLTAAKITKCKHFYHEICLRKWLYVQDTCPLCHAILYNIDSADNSADNAGQDIAQLDDLVADAIDVVDPAVIPRVNNDIPSEEGEQNAEETGHDNDDYHYDHDGSTDEDSVARS
uniref:Protein TRC8 homolog n=3 Tax=Hirondellea gigas TaxID=1518452 RepID=A0A6A7G797_9CRUS